MEGPNNFNSPKRFAVTRFYCKLNDLSYKFYDKMGVYWAFSGYFCLVLVNDVNHNDKSNKVHTTQFTYKVTLFTHKCYFVFFRCIKVHQRYTIQGV